MALDCQYGFGKMTLSAGLSTLRGQFTTNYPVLMAGSMLAMIPIIILYLLFQKQFIEGIAMTGRKIGGEKNGDCCREKSVYLIIRIILLIR